MILIVGTQEQHVLLPFHCNIWMILKIIYEKSYVIFLNGITSGDAHQYSYHALESSGLKFAWLHSHAVLWPPVWVHSELIIISAVG